MSSKQIADVVNSRHDSVKRTIDTLAEKGVIQLPQTVEVKNHLGQTVTEYQVNERDSYVVVAQLCPEFTAKLVDYWQATKAIAYLSGFIDCARKAQIISEKEYQAFKAQVLELQTT